MKKVLLLMAMLTIGLASIMPKTTSDGEQQSA